MHCAGVLAKPTCALPASPLRCCSAKHLKKAAAKLAAITKGAKRQKAAGNGG